MNEDLVTSSCIRHREHRERSRRSRAGSWLVVLVASWLASCAQAPAESRTTADVIMLDRLETSVIVANRANAIPLAAHPLADAQSRVSSNAAALLASSTGIELFSFFVSCALPADVTLLATIDGAELEFFGEFGLAPQWRSAALDFAGQRWVSACVFARVNAHDLAVAFSARGPNLGLAADGDERAAFTLEEGAFYGNLFVPLSQPIQWFACRGRDEAAGQAGGLADRDCADQDPAKPNLTVCGFVFTGNCGSFAGELACESFSPNGTYYRRCHTAPTQNGQWQGEVFEQVITTFVRP
jgi:hypothetical protein